MSQFRTLCVVVCWLCPALTAYGQEGALPPSESSRIKVLEERLDQLTRRLEQDESEQLARDARTEASSAAVDSPLHEREFRAGSLGLQKLNPEITLSGDFLVGVVIDDTRFYAGESDRSGFLLRGAGLHIQHELDPYSNFKSAFHFSPEHGAGLEELYVNWHGVVPSVSLYVGRFRQQFGVVNRWHVHALDQTTHPLAMTMVLGDEGLVGDGVGLRWLMPRLWAHANELTVEIIDGSNETLFSGEHFSVPSAMLHLKNYWDLSSNTYLELGLTGMYGFNNKRGLLTEEKELVDEPWQDTVVAGANLTLYWSPASRARYRSFTWRTEAYLADKKLPSDAGQDCRLRSWGAYSYLQYQLSQRWHAGLRGDIGQPTNRPDDALVWDVVPYVTFWQSEFVYMRLEYRHGKNIPFEDPQGDLAGRTDNRVMLQVDFAAGPHKHEKY